MKNLIRVHEVMQDHFLVMPGLATVGDAILALKRDDSTVLIVEKRDENDEYGIVLLSDIAKKVLAKDRSPYRVNVYEIMSKPVISIAPEMDVRYCARLFEQFGLSQAPVVEQGKIVGVVDYNALVLKGLVELREQR
jgi:predicted transcriptional regulator